jgi:hypothetical protein
MKLHGVTYHKAEYLYCSENLNSYNWILLHVGFDIYYVGYFV